MELEPKFSQRQDVDLWPHPKLSCFHLVTNMDGRIRELYLGLEPSAAHPSKCKIVLRSKGFLSTLVSTLLGPQADQTGGSWMEERVAAAGVSTRSPSARFPAGVAHQPVSPSAVNGLAPSKHEGEGEATDREGRQHGRAWRRQITRWAFDSYFKERARPK